MNYQRTKPNSKRGTKIIAAVAVLLILMRLVIPHAFAAFFTGLFSPLWRFENFVVHSAVPENQIIFSSDSIFASSTVADLQQENSDLKGLLGRATAQNATLAAVLSKPPFAAYDTLIVDAGSDQGIAAGDSVYALAMPVVFSAASGGGADLLSSSTASSSTATSSAQSNPNPEIEIPIGSVTATYGETSLVTLFSSPGQKYAVEIGSHHISATAQADGAGMFEVMVPNNSDVTVGDPVVIPGIQSNVFASVVSVVSDPARPYSLVLFQTPVDPFSLYFVEIQTAGAKATPGATLQSVPVKSHAAK